MKTKNLRPVLGLALALGVLAAIAFPREISLVFGIPAAGLIGFATALWISE